MTAPVPPLTPEDFYYEDGLLVFTAAYLRKRGACCGNGCRHCPYASASELPAQQNKSV